MLHQNKGESNVYITLTTASSVIFYKIINCQVENSFQTSSNDAQYLTLLDGDENNYTIILLYGMRP